jgi:hypothetical protein
VSQSAVDQLDKVIALFDQAVSARESRARTRADEELVERAKKGFGRSQEGAPEAVGLGCTPEPGPPLPVAHFQQPLWVVTLRPAVVVSFDALQVG